jgi:phosphoribosylformylglycinamidine synthase
LDPQGVAVRDALHHLGGDEARNVRVGKLIEIEWDGSASVDDQKLNRLCRELLSNPVIEDYKIEIAS